ncbi:TetR/AcrR family transcriptional regulator [Rubneribacter sp.]
MGRPRKDANAPDAQQRLVGAFWLLLETSRVSELTVGTLCAQAGCNRGTFYYHFADLDALVYRAIEQELLGRDSVAAAVFGLLSGTGEAPLADMADERRMRRMGLLLEQGGTDLVTAKIKEVILGMWHAVLRPDGSPLSADARIILEFAASGMMGFLAHRLCACRAGAQAEDPSPWLMRHSSAFLLENLCRAEGLAEADVLARLETVARYSQVLRS